jgi:pimeloyl-ACP methyl ester carboxylesterase
MALGDLVDKITCPTFIVHGKKDPLVPFEIVANMVARLKCQKEFKVYEDGDHCCTQHAKEVRTLAAEWLLSEISKGA